MIVLNRESGEELYLQIYQQLRDMILNGVLKEGQVLASTRALAGTLKVSRNTVDRAYGILTAEDYIKPKQGAGHVVKKLTQTAWQSPKHFDRSDVNMLYEAEKDYKVFDLTNRSFTKNVFPAALWQKYMTEEITRLMDVDDARITMEQNEQVDLFLRRNLCVYLQKTRGIQCEPRQIVTTCSASASLDSIAAMMSWLGTVWMDQPFVRVERVLQKNGLAICDHQEEARLLHVMPANPFSDRPAMTVAERKALLSRAKEQGQFVIENDECGDLDYLTDPIPPLQALDPDDRVFYVGSFAQSFSSAMRISYFVVPKQMLELCEQELRSYEGTVSVLSLYVVARMIETGQYERHVRHLSSKLRKRFDCMRRELDSLGTAFRIYGNDRGHYFAIEFPQGVSSEDALRHAREKDVILYTTVPYGNPPVLAGSPNTLYLGCWNIYEREIPECVQRLKEAWRDWIE